MVQKLKIIIVRMIPTIHRRMVNHPFHGTAWLLFFFLATAFEDDPVNTPNTINTDAGSISLSDRFAPAF